MQNNEINDLKDLINAYFDALKKTTDYVQSNVINVRVSILEYTKHENSIIGIFMRIHALSKSLTRLNKIEDFNSVAIIARTLFELWLDLRLLTSKELKNSDLEKFFEFKKVNGYKKALAIEELRSQNSNKLKKEFFPASMRKQFLDNQDSDKIERLVVRLWGTKRNGDPKWPSNWSGDSVYDRARSFGINCEHEYREVYSFLSIYTHSGNSAYSGQSKEELQAVYGICLNYARDKYIESLIIYSYFFKLDLGINNFDPVLKYLKKAPEYILTTYFESKDESNSL